MVDSSLSGGLTIMRAFELYIDDFLILKNRSAKTIESYDVTKKCLTAYTGNMMIENLDLKLVLLWIKELKTTNSAATGKPRSINTIRGYVMCLRGLLTYLKERGYNVMEPAPIPVPERVDTVPAFLTVDEVGKFIALAGQKRRGLSEINRLRNQAIVSLIFGSGVRVSELCAMNRDCFFNDSFTVIGKGRQPGLCFLDQRTKRYIDAYMEKRTDLSDALFIANQTGNRMTPSNVREMFGGLSKIFGKRVHPHVGRHSLATELLVNNTNPRHVQAILRHRNLQTVQVYTHIVNEDLKQVFQDKHKA